MSHPSPLPPFSPSPPCSASVNSSPPTHHPHSISSPQTLPFANSVPIRVPPPAPLAPPAPSFLPPLPVMLLVLGLQPLGEGGVMRGSRGWVVWHLMLPLSPPYTTSLGICPVQVFGNSMGPGGNTSGNPMMPGMAGSGSGMNSPQFMGQQPFPEGAASKGYVQQGMYGRSTYPGGPGFTTR